MLLRRPARTAGGQCGQALLEFAIVLPVFLMMVFAILDVGRVVWAMDSLNGAAREAARYASVHGDNEVIDCPTGPNLLPADHAAGCPSWTPDSKEPTRQAARGHLVAPGTNVEVQVCYYTTVPCSGNTDQAGATNGRGGFVTVTIRSTVPILTGSLLGLSDFAVSASSTALINN